MILGACIVLLTCALILLLCAIRGPTAFDRVLAVNAMGTKTVLLIACLGFLADPGYFLDTSLVYALINFVATIAILRYIQHRRLG